MIAMTKSFREDNIQAEFMQSGNIMEKMSREIRYAYGINSISASDLVLNTKDSNGTNITEEFSLSNPGNVHFLQNGVLTGNLNTPKITVTALSFSKITTTQSQAVKISLTVKSSDDASGRLINFYDTIVLRGSY